jgi:hypothetical protein
MVIAKNEASFLAFCFSQPFSYVGFAECREALKAPNFSDFHATVFQWNVEVFTVLISIDVPLFRALAVFFGATSRVVLGSSPFRMK